MINTIPTRDTPADWEDDDDFEIYILESEYAQRLLDEIEPEDL